MSRNSQRGQTLPVWAFGTLTVMMLAFMALNYGWNLTWQIRAQNAADSAAQGLASIQASQWNQMLSAVHASAVEEYRIRYLLNDLQEVAFGNGGCIPNTPGAGGNGFGNQGPTDCDTMYATLRAQYMAAVSRYTSDVLLVNRLSSNSFADLTAQMNAALNLYSHNVGDTAFKYTIIDARPRSDNYLENVYADCCGDTIGGGTTAAPKPELTPVKVEVVACASVTPFIAKFFSLNASPYLAIGRAASTTIMASQEFMYVGSLTNTLTNDFLQPTEFPETNNNGAADAATNDANYRIDFGGTPQNAWNHGNPSVSNGVGGFTSVMNDEGMEPNVGWWTTMSIKPYMGDISPMKGNVCS